MALSSMFKLPSSSLFSSSLPIVKNVTTLTSPLPRTLTQRRTFVDMSARALRDMNHYFREIVSAQPPPPNKVNRCMDMIMASSPSTVSSYNVNMRENNIKGLYVKGKKANDYTPKRVVILASGLHADEKFTTSVSLHIAASLSQSPIEGADLSIFPLLNPKEFELGRGRERWLIPEKEENEKDASSSTLRGILGRFLRNPTNYVSVSMEMNQSHTVIKYKGCKRHNMFDTPEYTSLSHPTMSFADLMNGSPAIVIELRDKEGVLDEKHIVNRGKEVIATIQRLIKETDVRGL